jgi:dynein light intermediate chain
VTISEPDQGLLLLRVRDDIKNTISAYFTLYQSAVTFAMRKQLHAEHGKPELEKRISDLTIRNQELGNKIVELEIKKAVIDQRNDEKRAADNERRQEEQEFLFSKKDQLEKFLQKLKG